MNVCAKVEYLEPLFKGSMRLKENIFKSRRVKIYAEIKTRTGLLCLEEEKSESLCNQIQSPNKVTSVFRFLSICPVLIESCFLAVFAVRCLGC